MLLLSCLCDIITHDRAIAFQAISDVAKLFNGRRPQADIRSLSGGFEARPFLPRLFSRANNTGNVGNLGVLDQTLHLRDGRFRLLASDMALKSCQFEQAMNLTQV